VTVSGRFDPAEAAYLSRKASEGELVTYGEFARRFGGIAQGQGSKLTQMGERLRAHNLPLLPVLVVNAESNLPSKDASFYKRLGFEDEDALQVEQQKCFDHDWTNAPFWKEFP